MLPIVIIVGLAFFFFVLERIRPGRRLPETPGWYVRAALLNLCQLAIVILGGHSWNLWLQGKSLLNISGLPAPFEGFLGWFIGTLIFYWWHRARHDIDWIWRVFHQVHHSPARIEMLTAFYKHPLEIAVNSIIAGIIMFTFLGASIEGAAWFNVFAAGGEYFYHSNLHTPHWLGYFIQRPEQHSIHHQLGVHAFNYGDITWWDRLFGTFREAEEFVPACGFAEGGEQYLLRMLAFKENP